MSSPTASEDSAADSAWARAEMPALRASRLKRSSATGERQMLPWQRKRIFFEAVCLRVQRERFGVSAAWEEAKWQAETALSKRNYSKKLFESH